MIKVRNIYTDAVEEFDTIEAAYAYFDAVDGIGWVVTENGREILRDEEGFFTVNDDGDEIRY